jgi:hypothetical protein
MIAMNAFEWEDYLTVHAAIRGLGRADPAAIQRMRDACAAVKLDDAATTRVVATTASIDRTHLDGALQRLRSSTLRFALLADTCQMARAVGIDRTDREPALVTLSRTLAISAAQHEAIAAYIAASVRPQDPGWGGWRLQIDELRTALARAKAVGVSTAMVSGTGENSEGVPNLGGGSFLGVIRLMHELTLL